MLCNSIRLDWFPKGASLFERGATSGLADAMPYLHFDIRIQLGDPAEADETDVVGFVSGEHDSGRGMTGSPPTLRCMRLPAGLAFGQLLQ